MEPAQIENGKAQCHLLGGYFAAFVQICLAATCVVAMVLKRHNELPKRSWDIWLYDVMKQSVGASFGHFANIFLSMIIARTLTDADECQWYALTFVIDSTLGTVLNIIFLRLFETCMRRFPGCTSMHMGEYGNPPRVWVFSLQLLVWLLIVAVAKVLVLLFMWQALQPMNALVQFLFQVFADAPELELVFVMIVIPTIFNTGQFWVTDMFLKGRGHHKQEQDGQDSDPASHLVSSIDKELILIDDKAVGISAAAGAGSGSCDLDGNEGTRRSFTERVHSISPSMRSHTPNSGWISSISAYITGVRSRGGSNITPSESEQDLLGSTITSAEDGKHIGYKEGVDVIEDLENMHPTATIMDNDFVVVRRAVHSESNNSGNKATGLGVGQWNWGWGSWGSSPNRSKQASFELGRAASSRTSLVALDPLSSSNLLRHDQQQHPQQRRMSRLHSSSSGTSETTPIAFKGDVRVRSSHEQHEQQGVESPQEMLEVRNRLLGGGQSGSAPMIRSDVTIQKHLTSCHSSHSSHSSGGSDVLHSRHGHRQHHLHTHEEEALL